MTPRQKQVLDYIKAYHEVRGYAPTFSLIGDYCGIKSKSSIHRILKGLEQQRLIQRNPSRARRTMLMAFTTRDFLSRPETIAKEVYEAMRGAA